MRDKGTLKLLTIRDDYYLASEKRWRVLIVCERNVWLFIFGNCYELFGFGFHLAKIKGTTRGARK